METNRPCGCKGRRTCLLCEQEYNINKEESKFPGDTLTYVYCPYCHKAYPGWSAGEYNSHPDHKGDPIDYGGVYIQENFLSETEETDLVSGIDSVQWDLSQSGRRKQNYGPKCNFRKRKLRLGDFVGFPAFSRFVQDKFRQVPLLQDYQTIEQCSLEYTNERGASIDAHVDDCWIWGERIISVNLLSDSVLTMTVNSRPDKYNLDLVSQYGRVLNTDGTFNGTLDPYDLHKPMSEVILRIPMPRRSLLVLYGEARYDWEHRILRDDIVDRRICVAYREFTPDYLPGGKFYNHAIEIFDVAKKFI